MPNSRCFVMQCTAVATEAGSVAAVADAEHKQPARHATGLDCDLEASCPSDSSSSTADCPSDAAELLPACACLWTVAQSTDWHVCHRAACCAHFSKQFGLCFSCA